MHKDKLINKLYEKPEKKEDPSKEKMEKMEEEEQERMERDLLEKEINKNKPVSIPGFRNANQLNSKKQFMAVHLGNQDSNTLKPINSVEALSHEEIVQILREKKAKKEL